MRSSFKKQSWHLHYKLFLCDWNGAYRVLENRSSCINIHTYLYIGILIIIIQTFQANAARMLPIIYLISLSHQYQLDSDLEQTEPAEMYCTKF